MSRIVIVGGSSSVGRSVASAFAARSDTVLATYARSGDGLPEGAQWVHLDLRARDGFADFAHQAHAALGGIDHLVLLAGVLPGKGLDRYPDALVDEVMAINFSAQVALVREIAPLMEPGGSVLAMSSISAQQGSFDPVYAASKAALIAFMKSLAAWQGDRLRFNCLAPGLIEQSAMYNSMSPDRQQFHRDQVPSGELLSIEDISAVIVDLVQPHWRHLNGGVVSLNGGRLTAG